MQVRNYPDIRDSLKTGDIVLYSGKGAISTGIKWSTFSRWSHVAMILNLEDYDFLALWEPATLGETKSSGSNEPRKGVKLTPLSDIVSCHSGEMVVRRLRGVTLNGVDMQRLMRFRAEIKGRRYDQGQLALIGSAYVGPFGLNDIDLTSLFCSQLLAETYQQLGLLSEGKSANEYMPADFSEKRDGGLRLLRGSLDPEILIRDAPVRVPDMTVQRTTRVVNPEFENF